MARAYHDDITPLRVFCKRVESADGSRGPQDFAVEHACRTTPPLKIFSEEQRKGKRIYLVGSWEAMLRCIATTDFTRRAYYEMIMHEDTMGCAQPVKFYADIEVDFAINGGRDFSALSATVETLVREAILALCPETTEAMQCAEFVWLDASNEEKLSYHLVVNIPGFAFESAFACGRVMMWVLALARQRNIECMFSKIMLNKQATDGSPCDTSVYCRNRLFRMWKCTKKDKARWLLDPPNKKLFDAGECRAALTVDVERDRAFFFKSCCTHFFPGETPTILHAAHPKHGTGHDTTLELLRLIPRVQNIVNDDGAGSFLIDHTAASAPTLRAKRLPADDGRSVPEPIRKLVYGTLRGIHVREIRFFPSSSAAHAYTTSTDCKIQGRPHDSNHIWFIFFCGPTPPERGYAQRCRDDNCKKMPQPPKTLLLEWQHALVDEYWLNRMPVHLKLGPLVEYMKTERQKALHVANASSHE